MVAVVTLVFANDYSQFGCFQRSGSLLLKKYLFQRFSPLVSNAVAVCSEVAQQARFESLVHNLGEQDRFGRPRPDHTSRQAVLLKKLDLVGFKRNFKDSELTPVYILNRMFQMNNIRSSFSQILLVYLYCRVVTISSRTLYNNILIFVVIHLLTCWW